MVNFGEKIMTSYITIKTQVGDLMLVANATELTGIYFVGCDHLPAGQAEWKRDPRHPILVQAKEQLHEYFAGKRTEFTLPLGFAGTDFQERVWRQIARVPFGKTISYA